MTAPRQTCQKAVPGQGGWYRSKCSRYATRDGYCKQHHPDVRAAKQAAWKAKYEAERRESAAQQAMQNAERAVIAAAESEVGAVGYGGSGDELVNAVHALQAAREEHAVARRARVACQNRKK